MESICKLCKYSQICGTGITGEGHTVTVWCSGFMEQKPITNADRLNAMTVEEKAEFLAELSTAPSCTGRCHKDYEIYGGLRTFCHDCWL